MNLRNSQLSVGTFAVASMLISGATNLYLMFFLAKRFEGPEFAEYASMAVLVGSLALIAGGAQLSVSKNVTQNLHGSSEWKKPRDQSLLREMISLVAVLSLIWLPVAVLLSRFLDLDLWITILAVLALPIAFTVALIDGAMIGLGNIQRVQVASTAGSVLRLVLGVVAVLLGARAESLPILLAVSGLAAALIVTGRKSWATLRTLAPLSLAVILRSSTAALLFWLITQVDVLFAQARLTPIEASSYSLGSSVVKAMLGIAIASGLLIMRSTVSKKHTSREALRAGLPLLIIGVLVLAGCIVASLLIEAWNILPEYIGLARILLFLGLGAPAWIVVTGFSQSFIALSGKKSIAILGISAIVLCAAYSYAAPEALSLALVFACAGWFLVLPSIYSQHRYATMKLSD